MKNFPLRTFLFGRSLLMAGLETTLETQARITIVKRTDALSELMEFPLDSVDLVIFDRSLADAQYIPGLIGGRPNLMVLGMDFSTHQITFYEGKEFKVNNFSEITHLIFDQAGSY